MSWWTWISFHPVALGRYQVTGSVMFSRPCSCSFMTAAAVSCFVFDPMGNTVLTVFGTENSWFAIPYPFARSTVSSRATRTVPLNLPASVRAVM